MIIGTFYDDIDGDYHYRQYQAVRNFSHSSQTSILGDQVFIDVLEADIITQDKIRSGLVAYVYLDDYMNTQIARYVVTEADRIDKNTVHIRAKSTILALEKKIMPAKMYLSTSFASAIDEVTFGTYTTLDYDPNSSIASKTISGFCPEQTARERLTWIMMACGGLVRGNMSDNPEIVTTNQLTTLIPFDKVFWHPSVSYKDYVTGVKVVSFSFSEGEPESGQEYVTDGTTTWIVHRTETTITNNNVPEQVPENVITVSDCMLINSTNAADIASRLSTYYFERKTVTLDIINSLGQVKVGDKVYAYISNREVMSGYVERCDNRVGVQMRSSLTIGGVDTVATGQITVNYVSVDDLTGNLRIATRRYWFPIGYETTIQNPYLTLTLYRGGYITYWFRPETETLNVVATGGMQTYTVNCYVALLLNSETQTLVVISVDEVDYVEDTEDGAVIKIAEVK